MSTPPLHVESQFGPLLGGHDIEAACIATLEQWLPRYARRVSYLAGFEPDFLKPIRTVLVATEMNVPPEVHRPCLIIVNNGIRDDPIKFGSIESGKSYRARWDLTFGVQAVAKGKRESAQPRALTLARMYILAVRAVMIQKRDADGIMGMTDWTGEEYAGLEVEADRTTALATASFDVTCDRAVAWGTGPADWEAPEEGEEDPDPVWPWVVEHDISIIKSTNPKEEG